MLMLNFQEIYINIYYFGCGCVNEAVSGGKPPAGKGVVGMLS